MPNASADLEFHEVDVDRWKDLETLFEAKGGPSYCWCMAWRTTGAEAKQLDSKGRKKALRQRVKNQVPVGLLAYREGSPVAWCSVAPRETFRPLGGPPEPTEAGKVWSVVCFYVPRAERRKGFMRALLQAAEKTARRHGAEVLEGYPVEYDSPSYRFMGFVSLFRDEGYEEVGKAGTRRHVVRRALTRKTPRGRKAPLPAGAQGGDRTRKAT